MIASISCKGETLHNDFSFGFVYNKDIQFPSEILGEIYQHKLLCLLMLIISLLCLGCLINMFFFLEFQIFCNIISDLSKKPFNELELSSITLFHLAV